MNGVPNSPINRYHQVEDAVIENNSIIASDHIELAAGADEERAAPPLRTVFRNNLIYNEDESNNIAVHADIGGIEFVGNVLYKVADSAVKVGFSSQNVVLEKAANGLLYPHAIDVGVSRTLQVVDKATTGTMWYPKPGPDNRFFDTGARTVVGTGSDALVKAISNAQPGDIIELSPGRHRTERVLIINKPLTLRSADPGNKASIEFERSALFEIADGGSLKLVGVDISGKAAPDAAGNTVIRTSRYSMLNNYVLLVDGVEVSDLNTNHSFNFFTVAKHTFANRIQVSGSTFRNITGHVLFMNRESDDLGIYNGEYVSITSSAFSNIEGTVADVYRGGTDESTFGPHFELSGSSLQSVGKGKRNKTHASVSLHGVQVISIHDNVFNNSQPVRVVKTAGEPVVTFGENQLVETESPEITQL
jgi:poly(beta-D-mannuronate) lyase